MTLQMTALSSKYDCYTSTGNGTENFVKFGHMIFSVSLSISIASRALIVQKIRLSYLSVHKSELWQNG